MKLHCPKSNAAKTTGARCERALTLVEMMITMGIFIMVVAALISAQIFSLRLDNLVESKLGASDNSREGFDKLIRDIREAKVWQVGNGSFSSFTPIALGSTNIGNALRISLTSNTNQYIQYYFAIVDSTNEGCLYRFHSADANPDILAKNLTNSSGDTKVFTAETYRGVPITVPTYLNVIHATLQFHQFQYPLTTIGPSSNHNYLYNFYQMDIRATPHAPSP